MNNYETDNNKGKILQEERWLIGEAMTIGLHFLHKIAEVDGNAFVYVFFHRFSIVRIRIDIDTVNGILCAGHVKQIGHAHYGDGEFAFDARSADANQFAVRDERETICAFLSALNKELLESDANNVN